MQSLVKVDESFVTGFLSDAEYRMAYIAPGISQSIAQVISQKWAALDPEEVRIVTDVKSETYRLGYGSRDGSAEALLELDA